MTQESGGTVGNSDFDDLMLPIDIEHTDPNSAVVYRMLYEHSQAALAYTQTLYDLSRRLVGAHHLAEVLDILCDGVKTAISADAVFVVLVDVYRTLAHEIWADMAHQPWLVNLQDRESSRYLMDGLVQRALQTGTPVLSTKNENDLRESPHQRILRKRLFGLCSVAVTPMYFQQRVVGAVVVVNQYPKRDFNSFDIELISTFAGQASLGVENARLQAEMAARSVQVAQQAEDLARSNTDLERFAYVVSHDLQEPLRSVTGYMELFLRRYGKDLPDEGTFFLDYALDGAERMRQLINDLLTYSRVGTRGRPPIRVSSEIAFLAACERLAKLIEESGAQITSALLPELFGDEAQIEQLFQNVLSNALKFRNVAPLHIHIGVARQDSLWRFAVQDNGIGIDTAQAERIFQVFQRLHTREEYPGNGIGLAICKRIVERHGGRIWFESTPGHGSTFYFTLPGINS
ncbi:GAF domain-containing protein [bacterium]|nr:GAF domain-containing protein [bacterium]